jgi:hypothetical protein
MCGFVNQNPNQTQNLSTRMQANIVVNMILVLLIIWNYAMLYLFTICPKFYQQMSNWLVGHYSTITTLLGKRLHQQ